jgi:hypothetical protein
MTPYKLTEQTRQIDGILLHRIELTEDCEWGKKGDVGGWIQKTTNLTEDAWVSGDAWEQSPLQIQGSKHFFNESKKGYLKIGCIEKSFTEWQEQFEEIGKEHGYTDEQIKEYGLYINLAIQLSNIKNK